MEQVEIGVIGMGSIGKMLTTKFSLAGYKFVFLILSFFGFIF